MSDLSPAGYPGRLSPDPMTGRSSALARNWWAMALRGVFAILFGVAALLLPLATLGSLVLLFAVYMLADGVFAIVAGVRAAAHHERWGLLIIEGVVNLIAGAAAFLLPQLTLLVLITLLGIWSVVTGVLLLLAAFRLHGSHGRWWMGLSGLFSLLWGVALYLAPVAGALVLTWWLGIYALVFGVALLVFSVRLRSAAVRP